MKKIYSFFIICFAFLALNVSAIANSPIKVNMDGNEITFDVNPQSINGRTMVPLRKIFESLNIDVSWDEVSQTITGKKDSLTIVLKIDNPTVTVNDKEIRLDTPATVVDGRTLVPVRFLAEVTGSDVSWDDATQTVSISTTSTEKFIKLALSSQETYVFQIQDDFQVSASSSSTTRDFNTNKTTTGTAFNEEKAKTWLKAFISKSIIRVNANTVSMDKENYKCKLNVLEGNNGIKIDITGEEGNAHYFGVIKGNTLTASGGVGMSSVINHVGSSLSVGGQLTVGIKKLEKENYPPLPVKNVKSKRNSDKYVVISWKDPNPEGVIESYDIYRSTDSVKDLKVASVKSGSGWIDTSEEAKPNLDGALSYYIIVHGKNGTDSMRSEPVFQDIEDLFDGSF